MHISKPQRNGLLFCCVSAVFFCISSGCATNKSTLPDLSLDNQLIVTEVSRDAKRSDCDTLVITCIDYRFTFENQGFVNETLGLKDNYDHISIPGSIQNLINPETSDLVLSKFALSVRLHLVKRIVIISHKDCGGYGGSASFGSELAEHETLCADLKKAREMFLEKYPTLEVNLFLESLLQEGNEAKVHFEKIL